MEGASAVLLARAPPGGALGLTVSRGGSRLLLSGQGDGVVSYDVLRLVRRPSGTITCPQCPANIVAAVTAVVLTPHSTAAPRISLPPTPPHSQTVANTYALGSSKATLLAPAVSIGDGAVVAALRPPGAAHALLVRTGSSSGGGGGGGGAGISEDHAGGKVARTLLDAEARLPLPSGLHSVHALAPPRARSTAAAAVQPLVALVFSDGGVTVADFAAAELRPCGGGSGGVRDDRGGGGGDGGGGTLVAASHGAVLAVVRQAPGPTQHAELQIFLAEEERRAEDGMGAAANAGGARPLQLQRVSGFELPCPAPGARLAAASLVPGLLLLQWRDGHLTAVHGNWAAARVGGGGSSGGSVSHTVATLELPPMLLPAGTASTGAAAALQATPAPRKRRAPGTTTGSQAVGGVLCCAVALSDTHVLLLTPPANAGEPASAVVLDARYGSCLASLPLQLPGGTAGNDAAGTVQLLPLPPGAGATAALLAAGGVYLLHIPLPRADLAGLIGRLGLHAADAPGAPGGTAVTCGQQVDLGALAAAVVAGGGGSSSGGGGGGAAVAVLDCQLLPVPTGTPGVRPLPPGASAVRAAAEALAAVLAVQPPALEQLKSCVQELCTALQQQQQQHRKQQPSLAGSAAAGVQQQSLTPGSRKSRQQQAAAQAATQANGDDGVTGVAAQQQQQQHALLPLSGLQLSQHLLARALGALADAKAWPLLEQLHALQPLQSLGPCPGLLPALVIARRYDSMRAVLASAQDVPTGSLVAALEALLTPSRNEDELAARRSAAAELRVAAEAAVSEAAAAVSGGDAAAAALCLAAARRAAAAVDGFADGEVLAHVLLAAPLDGVEAVAALRGLSTPTVLRLLRLLDKWVARFNTQPLRDSAAACITSWAQLGLNSSTWTAPGAEALLVTPSWPRVLDWVRMLLDAHLTRLALLPAAGPLLRRLQLSLAQEVGAASKLMRLKGVVDHMALGAPLPAVAEAASSEYTLELLDLRVIRC